MTQCNGLLSIVVSFSKCVIMRNKFLLVPVVLLLASIAGIFFPGCVKDKCTNHYYYWEPVYKTKAEARANIKNNPSQSIERPGKIYVYGNYIFLNEIDKGIHIIDNSNPSSPQNIAFINIPGNLDMAVKGNVLYADFYTDLVAINISNPQQVIVTKFIESMFPERAWDSGFSQDSGKVIVDWIRRDTTVAVSCGGTNGFFGRPKRNDVVFLSSQMASSGGDAAATPFGAGGSMARFTVVNNYMYAVSNSALNVVSIANVADPVFSNKVNIGWNIETIYPFNNRLFMGSNTGMFIYDIGNPVSPVKLGGFSHARVCDPVIADNSYAYVTLRSGTTCQGFNNQLDVLDITNITNPILKKTYPLTNPHGLSKDGNTLLICDGKEGVKFFNAADINNITLFKTISGAETYDVITQNGWALVVAKDGLYQYDFSSLSNIKLLSKLNVK